MLSRRVVRRIGWIALGILLTAYVASKSEANAVPESASGPLHGVMLLPTADLIPRTRLNFFALAFPPGLFVELAAPVAPRVSVTGLAGTAILPPVFGMAVAAASVRYHPIVSDSSRCGAALIAESIVGVAGVDGDVGGTVVATIAAVGSSPVGRTRLHAGVGVHTTPGEDEQVMLDSTKRDAGVAAFVAAEQSFGSTTVMAETLWGGHRCRGTGGVDPRLDARSPLLSPKDVCSSYGGSDR